MQAATTQRGAEISSVEPVPPPRPSTPAQPRRPYASAWKVWLPIPLLLLLLDCTFNLWFWKIPRISGEADFGYQFLVDLQRLQAPAPPGALRVLVFGSSVSGSFDHYQVQSLIEARNPASPVRVHRLLKPGIKPGDYRLLFEAMGDSLRPDVAVFTLNLLDFLKPNFERNFRSAIREALPPTAVLREHAQELTVTDRLDLGVAAVSNMYRYRKELRSALHAHFQELIRWIRAQPAAGAYGLFPDGYTERRFGVPVDSPGSLELEYYIDPEWIRQRGRITLSFAAGGQMLASRTETEPGWKTVALQVPANADRMLHVRADSAWNPRASGQSDDLRLLAVRLRQIPPQSVLNGSRPPYRYPPYEEGEIHPFLRMGGGSGDEFAARWNEILNSDTPFGTRFRAYRDSKLRVRRESFTGGGEYAEVARLVGELARRGTWVVLVNTPESPWLLREYQGSPYYRGYLQFFRDLAAQHANIQFYDLSAALPPEDFNDWHHVNYVGGIKLGRAYADIVKAALSAVQRHRGQGA
jgi:hypothetical protein